MIIHIILNTLLVFLVMAISIEGIFLIFKIENARLRVIVRSLPLLKIPFDLVVFTLYGDNLLINFNPFSCEVYFMEFIQRFVPAAFGVELSHVEQLIIPQYIAMQLPSHWLHFFVIVVCYVSTNIMCYRFYQFASSRYHFNGIIQTVKLCTRSISNSKLLNKLQDLKAIVVTSDKIDTPCAAKRRYIMFPDSLVDALTQEEFEAVIAHELEHLRWKDTALKLFCTSISALLWWIPTSWWLRRLEADQETASDSGVYQYDIDVESLASAVIKVVKRNKLSNHAMATVCQFASPKSANVTRLKSMLESGNANTGYLKGCAVIALSLLTFLCFWAC